MNHLGIILFYIMLNNFRTLMKKWKKLCENVIKAELMVEYVKVKIPIQQEDKPIIQVMSDMVTEAPQKSLTQQKVLSKIITMIL
eukprot:UN01551